MSEVPLYMHFAAHGAPGRCGCVGPEAGRASERESERARERERARESEREREREKERERERERERLRRAAGGGSPACLP